MSFFFEKKDKTNRRFIEEIILENYNQYYRLAYSYVHNESDAGDIVQNGAYQALRNAHTLKEPEYAKTWLYRIILNECFRYVKQQKPLSYEALLEQTGFESGSSEDSYVNIDLQRALDALPDKDKAIVILKYFEERTFEEIAQILDENVNTVKTRLYRSMDKLKKYLADTH
ncbi:MAG: sigma-70 family RNA polymerase sigma factor [bacterium]|nr:sigma-70 family RNA polymerase sigma factor [bacterium]